VIKEEAPIKKVYTDSKRPKWIDDLIKEFGPHLAAPKKIRELSNRKNGL